MDRQRRAGPRSAVADRGAFGAGGRQRLDRAGRHRARCLADQANGKLAICRDDFDGISTNAALLVSPEGPYLSACQGLPSAAPWRTLSYRGES